MGKYLKPIYQKIKELKDAPDNGIFLVGEAGSGKTTTLLEYINKSKNTANPAIDVTPVSIFSIELYEEYAKLYNMCNVIQKMLLYIKEIYLEKYIEQFMFFNAKITNIQQDIVAMYSLGKYNLEKTCITIDELNNPEILLEDFLTRVLKCLNYDKLTIILDNFDVARPYARLYQTYIYDILKKHFRVIATISDVNVINNSEELNKLSQNNSLVMMNYNRNVDIIKKVLDSSINYENSNNVISKRISFLFSDDVIAELIRKTNGNIFMMNLIVTTFFERLNEIEMTEYNRSLLDIANEFLNFNEVLRESEKKRKLYLK